MSVANVNSSETREVVNMIATADKKILSGLNSYMCTMSCPCDAGDANNTLSTAYKNLTEETYNKYGRTKAEKNGDLLPF